MLDAGSNFDMVVNKSTSNKVIPKFDAVSQNFQKLNGTEYIISHIESPSSALENSKVQ